MRFGAWALALACVCAGSVAAAQSSPAQSAFDRGVAYDLGLNGGAPDPQAALDLYRLAAAAELPAAQLNAALMYDSGRGTARDAVQAAALYGAAAAHGDGRAAFDIGQLYETGDGVPKNPAAAHEWFDIAAARGISAAAHRKLPAVPPATALAASTPVRPVDANISPEAGAVALVWTAPAEPLGSKAVTYVQLVAQDPAGQHVVYAGFAQATATTVKLPPGHAIYAWRTLTVSPTGARYIASRWVNFTADNESR